MSRDRKHTHPTEVPVSRKTLAHALAAARADLETLVDCIDDEAAKAALMGAMARYVGALVALDRHERPAKVETYAGALRALLAHKPAG